MKTRAIRKLVNALAKDCPGCNLHDRGGKVAGVHVVAYTDKKYRHLTKQIPCPWCAMRKQAERELHRLEAIP